ncbi:MAG: hypothetical protein IIA78_03695 [Proteobacteria bacterium]|nr:hypothetical protein [Pseudomonadota bacterium]
MTDADRKIDALLDQVDTTIVEVQVERHFRVQLAELGNRHVHVAGAE